MKQIDEYLHWLKEYWKQTQKRMISIDSLSNIGKAKEKGKQPLTLKNS